MTRIIDFENRTEWDKIVRSFHDYDVYFLSGYLASFKVHGDGTPILVYYQRGGLRAVCAFMLRDLNDEVWAQRYIGKGVLFDAITPYGYGGWLLDGNISEEQVGTFWSEISTFMRAHHIVAAFTRWCPWLKNQELLRGWSNVINLGKTVYIDCSSEEVIFQNLKSKDRTTIRKAIKMGIVVEHSEDFSLFDKFRSIYNATMDKDNADPYYYFGSSFYESVAKDLHGNWKMFYAVFKGEIIAMSIILMCNGRMHYHLSGNVQEYRSLNATNLILYEAARYGARHGYKILHLGGGVGSGEDPLYKFKKTFNKKGDLGFCISKDCFDKEKYSDLIKLRKMSTLSFDVTASFFPLYRLK